MGSSYVEGERWHKVPAVQPQPANKYMSTAKKHGMSKETTKSCLSGPDSPGLRKNCTKGISASAKWDMLHCMQRGEGFTSSQTKRIRRKLTAEAPSPIFHCFPPVRLWQFWQDLAEVPKPGKVTLLVSNGRGARGYLSPGWQMDGSPTVARGRPHRVLPGTGWQVGDMGNEADRDEGL